MTTCTVAPACVSRRASSIDLYAAIDPVTASTTKRPRTASVTNRAPFASYVQLVQHPQPLEREVVVHLLDAFRERRDRGRESAGGDDARLRRQLRDDARQQTLDEPDVAEHDPGPKAVRGVLADRGRGRHQRHAKEP